LQGLSSRAFPMDPAYCQQIDFLGRIDFLGL
jgi:hypothetical protein